MAKAKQRVDVSAEAVELLVRVQVYWAGASEETSESIGADIAQFLGSHESLVQADGDGD